MKIWYLVGGLEHVLFFHIGNSNPNWRTPSFFRGVGSNHQPDIVGVYWKWIERTDSNPDGLGGNMGFIRYDWGGYTAIYHLVIGDYGIIKYYKLNHFTGIAMNQLRISTACTTCGIGWWNIWQRVPSLDRLSATGPVWAVWTGGSFTHGLDEQSPTYQW
jgi:hypothetical protein